jgi:hypothetical protein
MNDALVYRVAVRYLKQAGWTYINAKYVNLSYSPTKWRVEETANGEPIPSMAAYGDALEMHVYEMPAFGKYLSGKTQELSSVSIDPETVRRYAYLHGDDKGPVIRQKIIDGNKTLFHEIIKSLKEEGDAHRVALFQKFVPELERKLIWKRVK